MPRIRRIKDYDFDPNEFSDSEESSIEGNSGQELLQSESWLSTKSVVANIPDEILRRSLRYYREIISTFEAEIRQRDSGLKPHVRESLPETTRFFFFPEHNSPKYTRSPRKLSRTKDREGKTVQGFVRRTLKSLNSIQKSQLLQEWSLIFKTLNKELNNVSLQTQGCYPSNVVRDAETENEAPLEQEGDSEY